VCTLLLRFSPEAAWPVVAGAVRDEFVERAWDPPGRHWDGTRSCLVGGRDRAAGGTWLAVDPERRALAALLNGVRLPAPADGAVRPTRGTLALEALLSGGPSEDDIRDHDGFHLVLATCGGVDVWSWDGEALVHRMLDPGDHILVNGGVDKGAALIPHTAPLMAALPTPEPAPGVPPEQAWGPWLDLMAGGGLPPDDERALIVRREVEGRTYGSTSATLVALALTAVRYDFTADPTDPATWREVRVT
jgi:hypothetical protein